ncbi:MAG: TolC family protein [Spirochaetes bacterium]|nr:TolC family protein [Spirochaetota bacterium]MBX3723804.1 TolC family protein [Turneriella sp.]
MFKHYFALFLALISVTLVFAEDKAAAPKEKAATEAKPSAPAAKADTKDAKDTAEPGDVQRAGEASFNIGGMKISLQDAINMVLEKNLTLQAAKYDVVMTDTNQRKLEKKYAPIISADARHLDFSSSPLGTLSTQAYQNDITASISKLFSTGTTVGGGYRMQNVQAQAIPSFGFAGGNTTYNGYFINVQQELLKNSFGYADRKMDKIAQKQAEGQRAYTVNLLSSLVVQALADYWQVTIMKSALENARLEEKSNRQVRAIVSRNVSFGLGETYDLNNYNARVAASQAKVAMAEQNLINATRKLLRTINMPVDTKIEGVTTLVDTLPELDSNAALKAAMEKRVDLKNAKIELEVAELQTDLYGNQALPSLSAYFNLVSQGTNNNLLFPGSPVIIFQSPQWQVGVRASYPLWDEEIKVNQRNAGMQLSQSRIKLANIEQEMRDEVLTRLENVRLNYEVFKSSRVSRKESESFYNRMLARTRTGKLNFQLVGDALNNMVANRQRELEALVNYNISLLQFDLAKNEIFERYGVNVEKILEKVK